MKSKKSSIIIKAIASFALTVAIICSGVLLFHSYYYESVYISGSSMSPTLVGADESALYNEEIDASKLTADFGIMDTHQSAIKHIKRFDIISTYYNDDYYPGTNSVRNDATKKIKRVIGLPNETIKIENGYLYVLKGDEYRLVNYPFATNPAVDTKYTGKDMGPTPLGNDQYWVLGDNRQASHDSAAVGAVRYKDICGVLVAIEGQGKLYIKRFTCNQCNKNFKYVKGESNICPYCGGLGRHIYDIKNKKYNWPHYY